MRTVTQETAPQTVLRNCSKEVVGEDQCICLILVKGVFHASQHFTYKRCSASYEELISPMRRFSACLDMRRCKDWDHEISS